MENYTDNFKLAFDIPEDCEDMISAHIDEESKTIYINIAPDMWGVDSITNRWMIHLNHNSTERYLVADVSNKTKVESAEISVGIGVGFIIIYANGNPPSFEESIVLNYEFM